VKSGSLRDQTSMGGRYVVKVGTLGDQATEFSESTMISPHLQGKYVLSIYINVKISW
jgi:hypothetical protein